MHLNCDRNMIGRRYKRGTESCPNQGEPQNCLPIIIYIYTSADPQPPSCLSTSANPPPPLIHKIWIKRRFLFCLNPSLNTYKKSYSFSLRKPSQTHFCNPIGLDNCHKQTIIFNSFWEQINQTRQPPLIKDPSRQAPPLSLLFLFYNKVKFIFFSPFFKQKN